MHPKSRNLPPASAPPSGTAARRANVRFASASRGFGRADTSDELEPCDAGRGTVAFPQGELPRLHGDAHRRAQ